MKKVLGYILAVAAVVAVAAVDISVHFFLLWSVLAAAGLAVDASWAVLASVAFGLVRLWHDAISGE